MIYWIVGGTAVGKKRFIRQALNPKTRPHWIDSTNLHAEWFEDGPVKTDIVTLSREADVLIRWQWGREEHLVNILRDHPDVKHAIFMLTTTLMAQLSRVALREGFLKWDAATLTGEQRDIYEMVHAIAFRYRVPVRFIDSTGEEYVLRRYAV